MNQNFKNVYGQLFQSGIGGTYPVNNGDPQCDVDEDEIPEEPDFTDEKIEDQERRIDQDNERYWK